MVSLFPRFNTMDFFLWGCMKYIRYRIKAKDSSEIKQRITATVATIDEGMLIMIWTGIEYRLDVIRATNGDHIEIY